MQIGLTQKLQNFLKRDLSSMNINVDPFLFMDGGIRITPVK